MTPRSLLPIAQASLALLLLGAGTCTSAGTTAPAWHSALVQPGPDGRLHYPADAEGNRIPDFSHAGYRGGGVPLPDVPVVKTLAPAAGDNTARLQAALDEIGVLPAQPDGRRGALLLEPGLYEVGAPLFIRHSGVVLRGSGSGEDPAHNTVIRRTGTGTEPVLTAGGTDANDKFRKAIAGTRTDITTPRVTVGSRAFTVADATLFHVGDTVIVEHPVTQAWIDAVGGGGTDTDPPWQIGERESEMHLRYFRHVTAIEGDTLHIDAPVFNHLDRALSQSFVYRYDPAGQLAEIGVENLFLDIVTQGEESENHAKDGLVFRRARDCWTRDVTVRHFSAAGIKFGSAFARGTAINCRSIDPHSLVIGARRYNFCVFEAQLILFENCYASHARHAFISNGTTLDSGIVVLDCVNEFSTDPSEGHRRWAQGLLFDGYRTLNPVGNPAILGFHNRGSWGTGHGWASVHSVAWNCDTDGRRLIVHRPPTGQNYAIGCFGDVTGQGYFPQPAGYIEGTARPDLSPRSLYRAQLAERLQAANP